MNQKKNNVIVFPSRNLANDRSESDLSDLGFLDVESPKRDAAQENLPDADDMAVTVWDDAVVADVDDACLADVDDACVADVEDSAVADVEDPQVCAVADGAFPHEEEIGSMVVEYGGAPADEEIDGGE